MIWLIGHVVLGIVTTVYVARRLLIGMEKVNYNGELEVEDRVLAFFVGFMAGLLLPGVAILISFLWKLLLKTNLLRTPNEVAQKKLAQQQALIKEQERQLAEIKRLAKQYNLPLTEELR